MPDRDPYKVLQVDREAIPEVIAAAFRVLARQVHPDTDPTGIAGVRMAELNRAYNLLRDPAKRAEHDRQAAATPASPAVPVGPGRQASSNATVASRLDRRHVEDPAGEQRIDFGRYAGWTLRDLVRHDPDYLRWLSRHSSGIRYRRTIQQLLPDESPKPFSTSGGRRR